MIRSRLAPLLALSLFACSKPAAPPPTPSGPVAWPDGKMIRLSTATVSPDRVERLDLRHEPSAEAERARLKLVLVVPEGERVLVEETVSLAQRDAAWSAHCLLVAEPSPGTRRAISCDGGASYATVLTLPDGKVRFCPHKKMEAVNGTPDWPKMLTPERWATGVLETAVYGCDEAGTHCQSSSQTGMTVHHTEPDAGWLVVGHEEEMHAAVAILETLKVDRLLGAAFLDAAVTRQRGLDAAELAKLGRLAAKALGPDGPFAPEERKALRLRVLMARDEAKKTPPDQLSPRASVAALTEALADLPQTIPASK